MNFIKKITKKQIVYAVLVIVWMAIVFAFSNQPAETSSKSSGRITETVVKIMTKEPEKMPQSQKDTIETIVRKLAHFSIYTIGGFLMAGLVNATNTTDKRVLIFAILLTTLYACTDEIHQLFVFGRSCEARDVLIDATGASLGTMIFMLGRKIRRK